MTVSTITKSLSAAVLLAFASATAYSQDLAGFPETLRTSDPGLTVIWQDAIPGSGGVRMMIRGIGSYAESSGLNTLKIYVDGFEVQSDFINYLNPEEIESVSVLKNAADLARYGMNGADGVLLITTKRGTLGAPKITFKTKGGVQMPVNVARPLASYEYAGLYNQAWSNDHGREWDPYYDFEAMNAYRDGSGIDVNWYDEVYRRVAPYADATLSLRGGSEFAKYNVVLDYANQQGFLNVKNTDRTNNASFVKYGVRTNLDMKLNRVLSVSVDMAGRLEDRTRPNYSLYALANDVVNYPSNIYPINDPLATDPISTFSGTAVHPNNPVGSLTGLGWTSSRTKLFQANFKFREDLGFLLKGLYLQESFSFYSKTIGNTAKTRTYARYNGGVPQTSDVSTYIRSVGFWSSGKERWMQGNVSLGWANSFGAHDVKAFADVHISDFNGNGSAFYNWKSRYVNYSGEVSYSYERRYDAALGFSLFGSDAYAPGRRYVFYPTLSLGWTLSNEEFLRRSSAVNFLKLRASAGYTGSSSAYVGLEGFETDGRYLYQQYYNWTGSFVTGMGPSFGGGVSGIRPLFQANENVTAEKSLKANVGVDGKFWNKLSVTADYFIDLRTNILTLDRTQLDYNGYLPRYANIGKMLNQGVDANIVFADSKGPVDYSVFGNFLFARNKILEMGEVGAKYPYNAATGRAFGTRMGLECTGFYEVTDFDLDGDLKMGLPEPLFGSVQPGDLKYKDQDGDGYIDDTDIVPIGHPSYPMMGFSFGGEVALYGFDLSIVFSGTAGSTVNLLDYSAWKPLLNYGNAFPWARDAWVYYPEANLDTRETATFPRLTTEQNNNNYRSSSFWIRNNNYLRLQQVELGYNIPVGTARIDKFRVFLSGYNLLTFSRLLREYKMDPETVNYGYPASRSVIVGLQISF